MNEYEGKRTGLREKLAQAIGDRLIKMAVNPRGCWILSAYEPEMPSEIILESAENKNRQ